MLNLAQIKTLGRDVSWRSNVSEIENLYRLQVSYTQAASNSVSDVISRMKIDRAFNDFYVSFTTVEREAYRESEWNQW